MDNAIKILIVEDEMIIGANIAMLLTKLGYNVSGMLPRGEEVMDHIANNKPDIILLDIQLKGKLDGIETAKLVQKECDIPIIFLTANSDDANFNRAKATNPKAFISKPFKKLDLQRAIELCVNSLMDSDKNNEKNKPEIKPLVLEDRLFVKHKERMVKLLIGDIYYIEAERNYCRIITKEQTFLLVSTLKELDEKLPSEHFLRVHRSFVVNLAQVDEVASDHVIVTNKAIPVSKSCKEELMQRIQTI